MKVRELVEKLDLKIFCGEEHLDREIKGGYVSDLLSDVMGFAQEGHVWMTLQTHKNVIAIASLKELACVILVKGFQPDPDMLEQAKDEVRRVGKALGIPESLIQRHPFPGPGLGVRILGDITPEKVRILQEADAIFIDGLKEHGLYQQVWQAGTILLPIQSVGVMGDERTYENAVALRAVLSTDGMTADWAKLPYEFLGKISNEIINKVKGINRVVYDISSKPPATIEWE